MFHSSTSILTLNSFFFLFIAKFCYPPPLPHKHSVLIHYIYYVTAILVIVNVFDIVIFSVPKKFNADLSVVDVCFHSVASIFVISDIFVISG